MRGKPCKLSMGDTVGIERESSRSVPPAGGACVRVGTYKNTNAVQELGRRWFFSDATEQCRRSVKLRGQLIRRRSPLFLS